MNKQSRILLTAITLMAISTVQGWAQEYAGPFFNDDNRPQGLKWLPAPPELTSGEFAYDFYYYHWGIAQREDKGEQAVSDEAANINDVFSEAMGIELSKEATPEIVTLAERCTSDALAANKSVKNVYQRQRPFAKFNEPSLKPETDEEEAVTFSYPSGHSSRGWMYAFALASVAPDRAEQLFSRAREYALNRVICGHHWKTDTDVSLMLSSGLFAAIVGTKEFQEQLVKAQQEYQEKTGQATGVSAARTVAHPASSRAFRLDGTQANEAYKGIVIKDGVKQAQ